MTELSMNRRTLLKALAAVPGGLAAVSALTEPIQRAFAIDPEPGTTFLDAEHVVFLMQENRSFDHAFGTLQGVRGFNDPRAIDLPGGRPVWFQPKGNGTFYTPFRLNMKKSNWTWMGCLPHNWPDQVDARNGGKYDGWLRAKWQRGPRTLGYCTRADIPFYYALADAFTLCDQHFCSSLTGTTPNRLHFWSGTLRPTLDSTPHVYNSDTDLGHFAKWTTFPERLLEHGISWKVYQNELSVSSGLNGTQDAYLGNFTDNPLEFFEQYGVRFAERHYAYLQKIAAEVTAQINRLEAAVAKKPDDKNQAKKLAHARGLLARTQKDLATWNPAEFAKLPEARRTLHRLAFTTNSAFPDFREVTSTPGPGRFTIPKGDIFRQFREDVNAGKLPTVSWLVAPQKFSDHPSAPWFGAWYVSEALSILTQNPEVWKKTIFVLNYDENDGFFDHAPPFVPPAPGRPGTGTCTEGIDTAIDHTRRTRTSPIGLGYRVPMIVASPWSRGGWVNSQVFDLTSPIRFLEHFLQQKRGASIRETNISSWRRAVTGDLTSIFRPWNGERMALPKFLVREEWMAQIYSARKQPGPDAGQPLTLQDVERIVGGGAGSDRLPRQEPGIRDSCALPYELRVDGTLAAERKSLAITFEAGDKLFGSTAAGAPFQVYAPGRVVAEAPDRHGQKAWEDVRTWNYAVAAGKSLTAEWPIADFDAGKYHLRVYGPNGFYRELIGNEGDPPIAVKADADRKSKGDATGDLRIELTNTHRSKTCHVKVQPNAYGHAATDRVLKPGEAATVILPLNSSFGWYDFTVSVEGTAAFLRRYAGRVETGRSSKSDPVMGRVMG